MTAESSVYSQTNGCSELQNLNNFAVVSREIL